MCTEKAFSTLPEMSPPEMIRSDLASTVLQLKALGIDNIMNFEWLSPPPAANMIKALELLYALQALDDDAKLTKPLGMHLAELPLEPQLGKALLVSGELRCVEEMLTVAAYLQVNSVWVSSRGRQKLLDEVKERFAVAEGDAVTALNIHAAYCKAGGVHGGGRARAFAEKNMLSHRALVRAADIRAQLSRHVQRIGLVSSSSGRDSAPLRRAMTRGVLRERGDARAARRRRRGRGVSIGERRRDVVYSPGERVVPRAARVRRLRASRADETGVHARRHRDRPGVVARARAALLREQAEERVREARGRGDDVVVTLGF